MPQEVQLPDGRILVIPDNITLDQRAALRNKLGSQYADIRTGKGMEARAQGQAKGDLASRVGKDESADTEFEKTYLPPTNIKALTNVLAGATGAGLGVRSLAGRIAPRVLRGPGSAGDVTVNPMEGLKRELEPRVPRNEPQGARDEMYGDLGERIQRRGQEQDAIDKVPPPISKVNKGPGPYTGPSSVPESSPFPGATSTGMPSMQGATGQTQLKPPTLTNRMGAGRTAVPTGDKLSKRIILPGERTDPMPTESAGSAAQATEGDLRRLADAGDTSAKLELARRRLPIGPTDYSKMPLPKGMEPVE